MISSKSILSLSLSLLACLLTAGNVQAQPLDQEPVRPADQEPPHTSPPSPAPIDPTTAADAAPPPALAGYRKGFFLRSDDGNFAVAIGARVQPRLEATSADAGDERDTEAAFQIARARLKLQGHAWSEDIQYEFQADFGKGFVTLKDFYIDYGGLADGVWLRAGQWKRPFSRQQITSSGSLELVDRAITDRAFGAGRDIGLAVHNRYTKSPEGLEWVVGIFNGTGDKPVFEGTADPVTGEVGGGFSNVPDSFLPAFVARVALNSADADAYKEADLKGGPLRWSVGASALAALDADEDDQTTYQGELDFIAKVAGFSTTGAVYVERERDDAADTSATNLGFHLQGGYVLGGRYQPAVRYALVKPDGADAVQELTAGFSVYVFAHDFKWQTDVSLLDGGADRSLTDEVRARTQLQLTF